MKQLRLVLFLIFSTTNIVAASEELESFGDTNDLATLGKRDFKVGDSFVCQSDRLAQIGFMVPQEIRNDETMGEITSYKDVVFGFSITDAFGIKFSNSYPLVILGNYLEAVAGLNAAGHTEYTLGASKGEIRKATPQKYHLRVVDFAIARTVVMHATCEKL